MLNQIWNKDLEGNIAFFPEGECKLSVLMAVYNGQTYVRQAIDSVLQQTFARFEFLIIDDASTDNTYEILTSYSDSRIIIIRNETNLGLTKSLNIGLKLAKGQYIARHDYDDVSYKLRFERQIKFLDLNPDVVLVGCHARIINTNGNRINSKLGTKPITHLSSVFMLMFENPIIHSAAMFRKEIVLKKIGGYDERFITNQDIALWSKLSKCGLILNLNETLLDFRIHENSVSRSYGSEAVKLRDTIYVDNVFDVVGNLQTATDLINAWTIIKNKNYHFDYSHLTGSFSLVFDDLCSKYLTKYPKAYFDSYVYQCMAHIYFIYAHYLIQISRVESVKFFYKALRLGKTLSVVEFIHFIIHFLIGEVGVGVIKKVKRIF